MLRILEVGIGLALVFTLVALICSILNEWISAIVEKRGNLLWEGIEKLVGEELRGDICGHQLMQGLVRKPTWCDAVLKRLLPRIDRAKPSYVPTELFVATLLDIVRTKAGGRSPSTLAELQTTIQSANVAEPVKQALLALANNASGVAADELAKAKKYIGDWFDAGMDRVTGWYKRWSQLILILVGLAVAFFLGVDCIAIAKRLWSDPIVRDQVVQAAEEFARENQENPRLTGAQAPAAAPQATAEAQTVAEAETAEDLAREKLKEIQVFQSQLEALSLPMFPMTGLREEYKSSHKGVESSLPRMFGWWLWHHLLGFVLTSLAASLGAPFWFDLLNRFVNLRTTGKKPEEAPAKP